MAVDHRHDNRAFHYRSVLNGIFTSEDGPRAYSCVVLIGDRALVSHIVLLHNMRFENYLCAH